MNNKQSFPKYPVVTKGQFHEWNEKMFKKYTNERIYNHKNPLIRFIERKRVEAVVEQLAIGSKFEKILAAGCGEGYIEKKLPACNLYLVDISKEAIKRARKTLKARPHTNFYIQDLEKMSFRSNYFDKIECSEVIEHVYNPSNLLSELARVLKSDGRLVMSFPNEPLINLLKKILLKLHIFHKLFPDIPDNMLEEWHLRSMDINRFRSETNSLITIIKVKRVPFAFMPIRYVVTCKITQ